MSMQNVNSANNAVKNHAEVTQKSPQIMADAINSGDANAIMNTAAAATITPHAQAVVDHQNMYHSQSVWSSILGGAQGVLKTVVGAVSKVPGATSIMEWASKPLQEIQRDYKFLHSVYTDHGIWDGALATLGVAGGATAGFFTAGPMGAVVGADLAAAGERNMAKLIPTFKDSVAKSEDPNYLVSVGRDVSNLLSNVPGFAALKDTQHGFGQTISGVTDAVFDFSADPLVKAGTINSALKTGKYVGAAVDDAGKVILDAAGKPVKTVATLPIAAQSKSVNDFMISYSGKAYSASQIADAVANPLNTGLRRAINTIAETKNPIDIQRMFPASQFTTYEAEKLAKAATPQEVVNEMGKSLYSKELLEKDYAPRTTLILPTQTIARQFVGKGLDALRQRGTTLNEERNLLLPRKTTVVDDAGNPVLNADGSVKQQTLYGALPSALKSLGLMDLSGASDAMLNGLAAKVRTFTGYKALTLNVKTLEQSGSKFDWDNPNLGPQIYNMAYYTMPHDLALEHTAKIMLEQNEATRDMMYANLVKETVKAAGLSSNDAIVEKVMSQAQRSTTNGELARINYGNDIQGAPRGYMDMKDGGRQGLAIWSWQRGGNAFIDFKELRKAMRETSLYSAMYQKADDFFTYYTDKIFAPLTLFTTGFGLRVASSEALHQVIRAGLGDYLQSQVAQSAAKYNILHKIDDATIQRYADSAAQALTEEDHAALAKMPKVITSEDSVTEMLNSQRVKGFTAESNPRLLDSLINYTNGSGDYSLINTTLRGDYKSPYAADAIKVEKITKDMDALIEKAPALSQPIITFRGLSSDRFSKEYINNLLSLKPGDTFTEKSFSSTDLNSEIANRFARNNGVVLEITNPAGTKGIFPIGFRTQVDKKLAAGEAEWVLPRNTEFKVTSIEGNRIKVTLANAPEQNAGLVVDNAVTKLVQKKAELYKSLSGTERVNELATDIRDLKNRIAPVGFINSKIAPYVAKDKLEVVTKYQQLMGGVGIPAGVASDHGKSFKHNAEDRVDILAQLTGHTAKPTEEIASLTGTNPHYHQYWALNLSKLSKEKLAQDIAADWQRLSKTPGWDTLSNDDKWGKVKAEFQARVENPAQYKDLRGSMLALSKAEPASYANEAVESFRGLVEGASGKIHDELINNIRTGTKTYEPTLKNIENTDSPFAILGKAHKPNWNNATDRVLDLGYRTVINPVIDHISREPIFAHYLYENFRDMKPMLDAGLISEDTALRIAGQKATISMLPLIHNPALRSQWATMSRNLFPFYFAQEQATKRLGRLAFQDGRALRTFREFQMIHQGMNNPGFVHTDSTGKKYIVYPLVGEFGNALLRGFQAMGIDSYSGMPESVVGNTASLATVLPEMKMPGVSPIGNVVLTDLGKRFPWMEKTTNYLSGGFPATDWVNTVLPNSSVRAIFNGLTMDQRVNAVHNATMSAIASAQFHGIIDDKFPLLPPAQQQQILDKIENNAKSNLFIQGILGFFLPLSPNVSNTDYNKDLKSLRSEFTDMFNAEIAKGNKDAFATAQQKFFADHGSQAVSYTVGWSTSKENGAVIPLSDTTVNWLEKNNDLLNSHANGAAYLVPQNTQGGNIAQIENKLLSMHLRAKQTPQEFMNAVYVQKGWVDMAQNFKDYQSAIKEAKTTNNISAMTAISQAWQLVAADYGQSNPIWWASYKDPTKNIDAMNSLKDLQSIQSMGKLNVSPQGNGVAELLASYNDFHAAIQQQTKGTKLTSMGYTLKDAWNAYLDQKVIDSPELTNVVNGVFRRVQ